MSTETPSAPTGGGLAPGAPAARRPLSNRSSVFALPASTSFRFALLIAAVLASSTFVYEGIYLATPRGRAWVLLNRRCYAGSTGTLPRRDDCIRPARSGRPPPAGQGADRARRAVGAARPRRACRAGRRHLLGAAMVVPAAHAPEPAHRARRSGAGAPPGGGARARRRPGLSSGCCSRSTPVCRRSRSAASGIASWRSAAARRSRRLGSPRPSMPSSCTNSRISETGISIRLTWPLRSGGLLWWPRCCRWQCYSSSGTWAARSGSPGGVAVLALTVYLLRNSIVRSREFDADARVRELDPDTALGRVLERHARPPWPGRSGTSAGCTRPVRSGRRLCLTRSRCSGSGSGMAWPWDSSPPSEPARRKSLMPQFTTTIFLKFAIPAVIFASYSAAALVIAMWRKQLLQPAAVRLTWVDRRPGSGSRPGGRPGCRHSYCLRQWHRAGQSCTQRQLASWPRGSGLLPSCFSRPSRSGSGTGQTPGSSRGRDAARARPRRHG